MARFATRVLLFSPGFSRVAWLAKHWKPFKRFLNPGHIERPAKAGRE
jgi:hypothetical protein